MSPLTFIVMLLIMIIIPTILYSFFFLINCPPNPCELLRRQPPDSGDFDRRTVDKDAGDNNIKNNNNMELIIVVGSNFGKDTECPVCLSVLTEGEELRQLKICKHFFHKSCIDKWLSTHFNCPVCRAFVAGNGKSKENRFPARGSIRRDDLWQGLPDSGGLI